MQHTVARPLSGKGGGGGQRHKKDQENNIIGSGGGGGGGGKVVSSVVDTGRGAAPDEENGQLWTVSIAYTGYVCCVWGAMTVNNININENHNEDEDDEGSRQEDRSEGGEQRSHLLTCGLKRTNRKTQTEPMNEPVEEATSE